MWSCLRLAFYFLIFAPPAIQAAQTSIQSRHSLPKTKNSSLFYLTVSGGGNITQVTEREASFPQTSMKNQFAFGPEIALGIKPLIFLSLDAEVSYLQRNLITYDGTAKDFLGGEGFWADGQEVRVDGNSPPIQQTDHVVLKQTSNWLMFAQVVRLWPSRFLNFAIGPYFARPLSYREALIIQDRERFADTERKRVSNDFGFLASLESRIPLDQIFDLSLKFNITQGLTSHTDHMMFRDYRGLLGLAIKL